jgi:hypothetical protein
MAGLANRCTRKPAYPKVSPPPPLVEDIMVQRTKKSRLVAGIRLCLSESPNSFPFFLGRF